MNGRSIITSAVLGAVLLFAGSWLLDHTEIGLGIKCRVLRDAGACLVLALTTPIDPGPGGGDRAPAPPPPTETPEQRAAREAAAEQARRARAVAAASSALQLAVEDVTTNADDLRSTAAEMTAAAQDLAAVADDGMASVYRDLMKDVHVRPMDDLAQTDVCLGLVDVELARGDVDLAVGDVDIAAESYTSALADRSGLVATSERAQAMLDSAVAANPGRAKPAYTTDDATAGLATAKRVADTAIAAATEARGRVVELVATAHAWMIKARKLASTVASC